MPKLSILVELPSPEKGQLQVAAARALIEHAAFLLENEQRGKSGEHRTSVGNLKWNVVPSPTDNTEPATEQQLKNLVRSGFAVDG